MAKDKDKRFVQLYKESSFSEEYKIMVDTVTGVNYIVWARGYAGGITPLLDREGRPVVSSPAQFRE